MFNRYDSIQQAILDKSIDYNTLSIMIDFYVMKGALTEIQGNELYFMMYPEEAPIV